MKKSKEGKNKKIKILQNMREKEKDGKKNARSKYRGRKIRKKREKR